MQEYKNEISRTCDFCGLVCNNKDVSRGDDNGVRTLNYCSHESKWLDDESEYETYDICDKCWEDILKPLIESKLTKNKT